MSKTNVVVKFDGLEYVKVESVYGDHTVNNSFAIKSLTVEASPSIPFRDLLILFEDRKVILCDVYINDKLFISGHLNKRMLAYGKGPNGIFVRFPVLDRFIGLKVSDIIRTKPNGSVQTFITNCLSELGYSDESVINTYNRKITKASDLLVTGAGVKVEKLKTFRREDIEHQSAESLIGESLSLASLVLISNGYDTLRLESYNSYPDIRQAFVDDVFRNSNILSIEKVGENDQATSGQTTPSKILVLNSSGPRDSEGKKLSDNNTAVLVNYAQGLPHITKVHTISANATYGQISKSLNYYLLGITAKSNSFVITSNSMFDSFGEFLSPNRIVRVYSDDLLIDEDMNILQYSFRIDSSGVESRINVCSKDSFDNNSTVKQKRGLVR